MRVTVSFTSYLRTIFRSGHFRCKLPRVSTVGDLLVLLSLKLENDWLDVSAIHFQVNGAYTSTDTPLADGDAVLLIPVIGGG